jgi:hypothetical protein
VPALAPRLELLWWEGCPSTDEALEILRDAAASLDLDPGAIEVREVGTDAAAKRERFVGSPTIRVDGADVQPPRDQPVGLTCRVYRLRDGRISPVPDRGDVHAAIKRALDGGGER